MTLRNLIERNLRRLRAEAFRRSYFGIVGGFLGFVSLFLNWYYDPRISWAPLNDHIYFPYVWDNPFYEGPLISGVEMVYYGLAGLLTDHYWNYLGVGVALFAVGSVVTIIWRMGIVAQAAGLLIFLLDFRELQLTASASSTSMWIPELLSEFSSGYVIALLAFLIAAFGDITPIWRRSMPTVVPAISRIATHSPNAVRLRR